jgi:hypothetical protein
MVSVLSRKREIASSFIKNGPNQEKAPIGANKTKMAIKITITTTITVSDPTFSLMEGKELAEEVKGALLAENVDAVMKTECTSTVEEVK